MERKENEKRKWEVIEDVVKKHGLKLEEGKRIISEGILKRVER